MTFIVNYIVLCYSKAERLDFKEHLRLVSNKNECLVKVKEVSGYSCYCFEFIIKTHEGGVKSPSPIRIDKKKKRFPSYFIFHIQKSCYAQ